MKTREYWKKRFELLEEAQSKKGIEIIHEIEKQFQLAASNVEKEIAKWYARFATENNINLAEAKRILNAGELAEFKWDVQQYIKYGEENALNGQWIKQLENASVRVHISRLEALKLQIQLQIEVVYGYELDAIDQLARTIYSEGYYHTAYEIQKGFNVGWTLAALDDSKISKVISKPWAADGRNFSNRIWTNKAQLINTLHTELTQSIIRGEAPDRVIKVISNKMNTSKNNAGRLVMTESAFFASAAQKDAFNELDVEKFEFVATLDNHTSPTCQGMDGKVFDMKDYQTGVNAPPLHVWCRSVTVPFFDDNFGSRSARNEEGKTYYVPASIKYPEWKSKFVN